MISECCSVQPYNVIAEHQINKIIMILVCSTSQISGMMSLNHFETSFSNRQVSRLADMMHGCVSQGHA
jgi:hypothetical protein